MSVLLLHNEAEPSFPLSMTDEPALIADVLRSHGVRFARWPLVEGLITRDGLAPGVSTEDVLAAYASELGALERETSYPHRGVVQLRRAEADPSWEQTARAARAKFLDEHSHAEDEVRFFVQGSGLFTMRRTDDRGHAHVLQVMCKQGDLLSVPAGTRHAFDMGTSPSFCAIRLFGSPEGWVASFTGDPLLHSFASYDQVVARWR
jgi:1,2-dihydroxy-3-keto-5-methylthiopentene dioxygenase